MQEKSTIYNIHGKNTNSPSNQAICMANTNLPLQISKSRRIKGFGENVGQLSLGVYISHLNVPLLYIISSGQIRKPYQTCFHVKQAARSRRVSRADLPPSVLWRNWQTEACLVLRPKPRNRRGDFEAQIIKPELSVLRPKPGNPPPPWFWGSTKKLTAGFEAKPGETVTTSFEAKVEKTVAAGFEAKPLETVTTGFEAKPVKTVRLVLRPNHSQIVDLGFKAQPRNPRS
jgi:hypothetical protein